MARPGGLTLRLIAWFAAVAVLPSAILAAVAYAVLQDANRDYFRDHLETTAKIRASAVEDFVQGLRDHAVLLALHDRDRVASRLDQFPAQLGAGIRYGFAGSDGSVIPGDAAAALSPEDLARVRAGEVVARGDDCIVGGAAPDGGAAFAAFPLDLLSRRVAASRGPGGTGGTFLVDAGGRRVDQARGEDAFARGPGTTYADERGVVVLGASAAAGPWRVVAEMDLAEVTGPLRRIALWLVALGALFFAIVVGAIAVVGRRSERSFAGMAASLDRAARGEFGGEVAEEGIPALRRVREALNEMHRRLGERDAEIRKQRQELFCQRCELERLNTDIVQADRLKSEFVANMSHEVRTPLQSILTLSGLLLRGAGGPLSEEQRKQIAIVERSGRALLAMLGDILDISKIGAGHMDVLPAEVSPAAVLAGVRELVAPIAEEKGLTLHLRCEEPLPRIRTDEEKLHRILLNLAHNAVKFTAAGGVELRCGPRTGGGVEFEVQDSGPGIEREQIDRIFEPFRQADGSMSRAAGGSGLGLTIARSLAELLGGRIGVDSEVGRGTTFRLSLPQRIPARVSGGARPAGGGREILVVGATPPAGDALRAELRAAGLETGRAVCGRDVRTALERGNLSALLCDVGIFAGEGLDVFGALAPRLAAGDTMRFAYWLDATENRGAFLGTMRLVPEPEGGHRLLCGTLPPLALPARVTERHRVEATAWVEGLSRSEAVPIHEMVRGLLPHLDQAFAAPPDPSATPPPPPPESSGSGPRSPAASRPGAHR